MRIMGIDFGDARTGVAVSDLLCSIVGSTCVVPSRNREKAVADIVKIVRENDVGKIVVGLPKNMNATEGDRVTLTHEFKDKLERRTGLPVVMWDERLTTVAADKAMMEAGIRREHRKDYVDMIAATLILQGYLDYRSRQSKQE